MLGVNLEEEDKEEEAEEEGKMEENGGEYWEYMGEEKRKETKDEKEEEKREWNWLERRKEDLESVETEEEKDKGEEKSLEKQNKEIEINLSQDVSKDFLTCNFVAEEKGEEKSKINRLADIQKFSSDPEKSFTEEIKQISGHSPKESPQSQLFRDQIESTLFIKNMCIHCGKSLTSVSQLRMHIRLYHNGGSLKWTKCDLSFSSEDQMTKKIQTKQNVDSQNVESSIFICNICSKQLSSNYILNDHLLKHGEPYLLCELCTFETASTRSLQRHMKKVHGEKKHACEYCAKTFYYKSSLDNHIASVHTKERRFQCEDCEYSAKTKPQFNRHRLQHSAPKYECKYCGKKIVSRSHYITHEKTHTGEKPYSCTECDYRCIQSYDMTKHYLKKHNMEIRNPAGGQHNRAKLSQEIIF